MCCGACLLFLCKIADSFLAAQKERNEERIHQRARALRRRALAASSGDPYHSGGESDSSSDDEGEKAKQE